jgi:ketosteroid isomerase-like protein
MKRIAVLALLACVACAATPSPRGGEISAAEVETALLKFSEAWEKEDLETAVEAFTPDGIAFDPVPPGVFERTEGIRAWISGSFDAVDQISIDLSRLRVHTSGPVAWATAHFVFAAQQAGKPIRAEGYVSTVWVRQPDGSLKLSVFHASHLPPATAG